LPTKNLSPEKNLLFFHFDRNKTPVINWYSLLYTVYCVQDCASQPYTTAIRPRGVGPVHSGLPVAQVIYTPYVHCLGITVIAFHVLCFQIGGLGGDFRGFLLKMHRILHRSILRAFVSCCFYSYLHFQVRSHLGVFFMHI